MAKQGRTLRERFDDMTCPEPMSGCLLWIGSWNAAGYGQIKMPERPMLAHRVAWMLEHGEIPKGAHVLHKCDTPACVNVRHLYLGDDLANRRDMSRRNRGRKSKCGLPYGVFRQMGTSRYCAHVAGHYLGSFATAEEAHTVAVAFNRKRLAGV